MFIVGNGRVITRTKTQPFIDDGAVIIDGNVILEVGHSSLKEKYPDAEFIDAKGGVIMPAFINAYEHIYSALARCLSINGYNPKSFLEILDGQWWNIDRHLDSELTKLSAL